mgnify:CR=1 FL=1
MFFTIKSGKLGFFVILIQLRLNPFPFEAIDVEAFNVWACIIQQPLSNSDKRNRRFLHWVLSILAVIQVTLMKNVTCNAIGQ